MAAAALLLLGLGDAAAQATAGAKARTATSAPGKAASAPASTASAASAAASASAPAAKPANDGPVEVQAREIRGRPDIDAEAEGDVRLQRGTLSLQADWLSYQQAEDMARARGNVRFRNDSGHYSGSELQMQLQRFEGFVLQPSYEFDQLKAGGRAARIDFLDSNRSVTTQGWYTSCPRDDLDATATRPDGRKPPWVLKADRVTLDFENNEGVAEGAVLRFLDVPILALPTMSFPLGDERKSGWLPPTLDFDTKSGLSLGVPYYWNIAPNRDATFTPRVITRRGLALETEFRWLEPQTRGQVRADVLPGDRVAGRTRWSLWGQQDGTLPAGLRWHVDGFRVSDDEWWKDFPRDGRSLEARLLPLRVEAERDLDAPGGRGLLYARVLRWQVLQASEERLIAPYDRAPQLGARWAGRISALGQGLQYNVQTEANRFVLPDRPGSSAEPTGWRAHVLGSVALPWRVPGAWLVPKLSFNAASYSLDQPMADGRTHASRAIPSFSVEAGVEFEREASFFGRRLTQTLEPRLLYVNTPYRDQTGLPNFDSAGKDFNFSSIFSENAFSGVDRVSDSHQITAGVISRLIDPTSGAEAMRVGIVQRYRLREQRITPEGPPADEKLSDVFLLGSAAITPQWSFDGAMQYSPDLRRQVRTVASARWSPGEFRTISTAYRLTRGATEQVEVAWQWPLWKSSLAAADKGGRATGSSSQCGGAWYTVGRVSYSMRDSRITDSILGLEYDAGCWISRLVVERLSTGLSEGTTRIQLQLELVGLSRLGSNPLRVLRDNVPGYRLLRDDPGATTPATPRYD